MRLSFILASMLLVAACSSSGVSGTGDGGVVTGPDAGGAGDAVAPGDASSGDSSSQASDMCKAYLDCVSNATPQLLASTLATYGDGGSCWSAAAASVCDEACHAGLVATHKAFPAEPSCNMCQTSADCPPQIPACDTATQRCVGCITDSDCTSAGSLACDTASATCVACTSNTYCSGATPVCDVGARQCVHCLANADCPSGTPACAPASHQCFECLSNPDCANSTSGKLCNPLTHSCGCGLAGDCGPGRACESGACCTPDCGSAVCGPSLTIGCGSNDPYACGICPNNGTCYQGACSDLGNGCTPGAGDCYSGEACVFNRDSQKYVCLSDVIGASCNNVYSCNVDAHGSGAYLCPAGTCRPYCLTAQDCPSGTCEPWGGTISTTSPGVCVVP